MTTAYLITNNAYDCVYIPATGAMLQIDNFGDRASTWTDFFATACGDFEEWSGGPDNSEPDQNPWLIGEVIAERDDSKTRAQIVNERLLKLRAEFHGYAA